jgi:hypothetical protein
MGSPRFWGGLGSGGLFWFFAPEIGRHGLARAPVFNGRPGRFFGEGGRDELVKVAV